MNIITAPKAASDNSRKWPHLAPGYNWAVVDGKLVEVDGKGWRNHLLKVRRQRGHYVVQRYFPGRDRWYPVSIKRSTLNALLVTMTPWWCECLDFELRAGRVSEVRGFLKTWAQACRELWEKATCREVVAASIHCDTAILHMDIWSTRVGSDNRLIEGSTKWVGLVGPQTLGVLRQVRGGFRDPKDPKVVRAEFRRQREIERHGKEAVNIQLADITDDLCEQRFGRSQFIQSARESYRAEWRIMERQRLVREREALVKLLAEFDRQHTEGGTP